MKVSVISFTGNGVKLSCNIADAAGCWDVSLYTKYSGDIDGIVSSHRVQYTEKKLGDWTCQQMEEKNMLIFIGACAIAVRATAPYVTDKLHDSPVLVVDEKGMYVIPILSGHMGGANEAAVYLAQEIGAVPVITTATDIQHRFAADLFAKKNHLNIMNKEGIAKVSSRILDGQEITLSVETGHLADSEKIPENICLIPYPPKSPVDILVTSQNEIAPASLVLMPKEYVVGMGCRKGKEEEKIRGLITEVLEAAGIRKEQVFALASIDVKAEEPALKAWCQKERIPFLTYSAQVLDTITGAFTDSEFVRRTVGVSNVCERAALAACQNGGILVRRKTAREGMTIAIAKREWSVVFDGSLY